MKKINLILVCLIAANLSFGQDSVKKTNKKQEKRMQEFNEMKELIESRYLQFIADGAYPTGAGRIDLTTNPNFLNIRNDSAHAELPYFGRAYVAPVNSDDHGIKYDGIMENFVLKTIEKKYRIEISYRVKMSHDTFDCLLSVERTGNASLGVTSNRRAFIRYQGRIKKLEEEEE